jgi:hypothetical protein
VIQPHVEDVIVQQSNYLGRVKDIKGTLSDRVRVWRGKPKNLYDGMIRFTSKGSGYISRQIGLPNQSVGFWITDKALHKSINDYSKRVYHLENDFVKLTYVGTAEAIDVIPAGTLLRVSLSRWWCPSSDIEERCYLQLSGWYLP